MTKMKKIVRMNGRGEIEIPKEFQRKLDLTENCEFQILLNPNGSMELRPVLRTPISYFVENNIDLKNRFQESMEQIEKGEIIDEEETRKLFLGK